MTPDLQYLEDRVLDQYSFPKTIEELGNPFVRTPGGTIEGRSEWEDHNRLATRHDRRNRLLQVEDLLTTGTPGACARSDHHRNNGSPDLDAEHVRENIVVHGDLSLFPLVETALARVPAAVRWSATFQCAFVLINETRGFEMSALFADRHGFLRERMIVLGPRVDVALITHEIAHFWTSAFDPSGNSNPSISVSALGEAGLRALARSQGWEDRINSYVSANERCADALALCWLLRSMPQPAHVPLPC